MGLSDEQHQVTLSFHGACFEAGALGRGNVLGQSFFIFNTEDERGPRRDVAALEYLDLTERIIGLAIEVKPGPKP